MLTVDHKCQPWSKDQAHRTDATTTLQPREKKCDVIGCGVVTPHHASFLVVTSHYIYKCSVVSVWCAWSSDEGWQLWATYVDSQSASARRLTVFV